MAEKSRYLIDDFGSSSVVDRGSLHKDSPSISRSDPNYENTLQKKKFEDLSILGDQNRKQILSELKNHLDAEIKKVNSEFERKKDQLEGKIESSKIKVIETLGIFVALFTFISTEFQVFKIYQNPVTIVGLTLIILGSLLIFVTVLDTILDNNFSLYKTRRISGTMDSFLQNVRNLSGYEEKIDIKILDWKTWDERFKFKIIIILIWFAFIITGVLFFVFSPETKDKYVKYNRDDYGSYIDKYLNINNHLNELEEANNDLRNEIKNLENAAITSSSIMLLNKDLNNSIIELKNKVYSQQEIIDCFSQKKYWYYNQCFK
jgi:uncharacterized membrane protein